MSKKSLEEVVSLLDLVDHALCQREVGTRGAMSSEVAGLEFDEGRFPMRGILITLREIRSRVLESIEDFETSVSAGTAAPQKPPVQKVLEIARPQVIEANAASPHSFPFSPSSANQPAVMNHSPNQSLTQPSPFSQAIPLAPVPTASGAVPQPLNPAAQKPIGKGPSKGLAARIQMSPLGARFSGNSNRTLAPAGSAAGQNTGIAREIVLSNDSQAGESQ